MARNLKKRLTASALVFVMAFALGTSAFADNENQLATPEVSQRSGTSRVGGTSTESRQVTWDRIDGAVSYDLYVFVSLDDARNGENAVARANIAQPEEGDIQFDFRSITFEEIDDSGVTWPPEVVEDENFVRGLFMALGNNLRPGSYWLRVRAIAADPANNSELSELASNPLFAGEDPQNLPIIIAMGPSEGRQIIEQRFDELGTSLFLVDVRRVDEYWDRGWIRFDTWMLDAHSAMPETQVRELLPLDATILLL